MTSHPKLNARSWRKSYALWAVCFAAALSFLGALTTIDSFATDRGSWSRVFLKKGKIRDYGWAVGARLPKDKPLGQICETSAHFLPRPEFDEVEVDESTLCGKLKKPGDSVSISTIFKSEKSDTTLLATLYRPVVRKIVFVLSNGEQRSYPARVPKIPNHSARGIPMFRYIVGVFNEEECLRKTITYDAQNKVIKQEQSEAPCTSEV